MDAVDPVGVGVGVVVVSVVVDGVVVVDVVVDSVVVVVGVVVVGPKGRLNELQSNDNKTFENYVCSKRSVLRHSWRKIRQRWLHQDIAEYKHRLI